MGRYGKNDGLTIIIEMDRNGGLVGLQGDFRGTLMGLNETLMGFGEEYHRMHLAGSEILVGLEFEKPHLYTVDFPLPSLTTGG